MLSSRRLSQFALSFSLVLLLTASLSQAADWTPITTDLIASEKPGTGGICGVTVHPKSGDVFINVSDKGVFRSKDQGKTWVRVGDGFKGRTETSGCMVFNPTNKTDDLLVVLVYGGPITLGDVEKGTWTTLDKKTTHVDWAAVNWNDPARKFVLTLKHESGGLLLSSHDGGQSFSEVGKGYGPAWIFDDQTAIAAEAKSRSKPQPQLVRTSDGGKTWQPVGEANIRALPQWNNKKLYWLTDSALTVSADEGKTWTKLSDVKGGLNGPIFGKDDQHQFVVASAGILESKDGGKTWAAPIALPKDAKGASTMTWLAYDPARDTLYTSKMATEVYKLAR